MNCKFSDNKICTISYPKTINDEYYGIICKGEENDRRYCPFWGKNWQVEE